MTTQTGRWRSRTVNLKLLGTAGSLVTLLAGCSSGTHQRNVYKDSADCAADYSLPTCTQQGYQQAARFFGPVYRVVNGRPSSCTTRDPGAGRSLAQRIGVEVARGGFACDRRRSWNSNRNSGNRWSSGG